MHKGTRVLAAVLAAAMIALPGCSSTQVQQSEALDPANPVQIEVWTYYNGQQQQAFEDLVGQFNADRGRESGVVVSHSSQGGVNDLAAAVTDSANGIVGAAEMPSMFLSYSDTALVIDELGKVADLAPYFTSEEREAYIEGFLAEGDLAGDGSIKVLPISKATETMQINMTDWQTFADQTNTTLEELETIEGIVAVAERYYEWTDAMTEAPDDGKAFYGRDSMANYLLTGSRQLGHDLYTVEGGVCTLDVDRETMRTLWDNYYVPLINGYFSAEGRYRSDAMKTGDLVCYLGSSSSVVYFPSDVTIDDQTTYPIEFGALACPTFAEGVACAAQQGAGFVVAKSDERTELACVEFLKWLSETEQATSFSIKAGYIPVTKEACTYDNIAATAAGMEDASANYLVNLNATLETVENGIYASAPFEGGVEAREVLESSLAAKAAADREQVLALMAQGASRQDAVASFATDENFDAWLESFENDLRSAIG